MTLDAAKWPGGVQRNGQPSMNAENDAAHKARMDARKSGKRPLSIPAEDRELIAQMAQRLSVLGFNQESAELAKIAQDLRTIIHDPKAPKP